MTGLTDDTLLAQEFEQQRPHLESVAYRMLGTTGEADDAVQEAWLRSGTDSDQVENLRAWLTTVVGRVALDMLRARKARREQPDDHLEPIVSESAEENPAEEAELADSVGLAMLVVLENLSPASASRSSCTTCSPCPSPRSPRSLAASPTQPVSWPAAPGGGCGG